MKGKTTILVVDDDDAMRQFLEEELREAGFETVSAADGVEALDRIEDADLVVTDVSMPRMEGGELLLEIRRRRFDLPVVLVTAFGSIESAVGAMKAGAYHYLPKPFRTPQLLETIESALKEARQAVRVEDLRARLEGTSHTIVTESPRMQRCLDMALQASQFDSAVLLLGESGTGKELLARMIHEKSSRRGRPFVAVNCSAIPEALLESQLFGHKRGAFTDAREDRAGLFQEASGSTLFLDEIGDMAGALQGKILRVLQEGEVLPVGASRPVRVDARIVAATHRDLDGLVRTGGFRLDLYYRLSVIVVRIPALRERPEDVLPLALHFLEKHGKRHGRAGLTLSPKALGVLERASWPGNARELENVIERCVVLGGKSVIEPADLPAELEERRPDPATAPSRTPRSMAEVEREHVLQVLRAARGNKAAAARMLGVDRKTLYRKLTAWRPSED